MYTNNGMNYTSGLSANPYQDRAAARKKIVISSVFLGIGVLFAFIGFILTVVAAAGLREQVVYSVAPPPPLRTYHYVRSYNNDSGLFIYDSNGGYFYDYSYHNADGERIKYSFDEGLYYKDGYTYKMGDYGLYESFNNQGKHFFHGIGNYCYNENYYYYYLPGDDFYIFLGDAKYTYSRSGDYFMDESGFLYSYTSPNIYRNRILSKQTIYVPIPGELDFYAPSTRDILKDGYGNYYRIDNVGFYYCDSYGYEVLTEVYEDAPQYDYGYSCYYDSYYEDYRAMRTTGIVMLIIGSGLTISMAISLSKARKALRASKYQLQAQAQYTGGAPMQNQRRSFCIYCGTKADSDAVYCVNCGGKL